MAGPLKEVGPAVAGTCTRFRRALLSDPERWCTFELGPVPLRLLSAADREDWLAAKLGLLHQVAGFVESFSGDEVAQLLEWAKPCRGRWTMERFLIQLQPERLTGLCLAGVPGQQALLRAVARFQGLTSLELSSCSTPLPKNTAAVVGALTGLRFLSLYSWGGASPAGLGPTRRPRLTRLPVGVVSEALPQLSQLTYLQLGALHVPAASQLTCLAPTLQLLSLFDQDVPASGLPRPPAPADWPLLTSYSADWEFPNSYRGKQVGEHMMHALGCSLAYGAATSITGRAVGVTAEVTLERSYYDGGTLQGLLRQLLPPGAALTQLTLKRSQNAGAASIAALRCAALSELQSLSLDSCAPAAIAPMMECTPQLTSLSITDSTFQSLMWDSMRLRAVPAAMAALPLRRVQLQHVDLPDLPAGRWLEELEELEVSVVRCLPAALAGTPIRRLSLELGAYGRDQTAQLQLPTAADVDNSLLLMPHLERLAVRGRLPMQMIPYLRKQAPHIQLV
ncbi:leucine-rich repeat (LRR) [Chlorella sorokiniana]|uniref:Leucine-rich repeat (LRR) n=1 Tax=Chlorella sorokiniana TaxID=3076 RepID=A0A2P6TR74_CHLSO|nr:leucine-rich repeat (LRR) [Chlorella sorokiniana]|eukprot:PRW56564.1 leucine-rich repeat (LRR) [Chlorella sorokiniana]